MTFDIKEVRYYSRSIVSNLDDEEFETEFYDKLIDEFELITNYYHKIQVSYILNSDRAKERCPNLLNVAKQLKKEAEKLGIDFQNLYIER